MRGLLLKDWYTLIKQMKMMLIMLAVFACLPGFSMASFAVFYASMLPVTALAYDERSKWDELAVMMPYSVRDLVLSKYILGALAVAAATVVSLAAQIIIGKIRGEVFEIEAFLALMFIACLSLILLCVNLPLMFRMGVEKGRIAFLILVGAGVASGVMLEDKLLSALESIKNISVPIIGALIVTAVVFIVSVPISVSLYKAKKG